MNVRKLDPKAAAREGAPYFANTASIEAHQVAVYVMCGGGLLGSNAAMHPADFYIDDRCERLPYSRKKIMQSVTILAGLAEYAGMNPHSLPIQPQFHNCGIF